MHGNESAEERYYRVCQDPFWRGVFQLEVAYLVEHLEGRREVLSVGCGPAIIEAELARHGFTVTGLDVSAEALERAPDQIRTVAARAEEMPFPEASFDAVIYVASLQFVEDYRTAIHKTTHVLRPRGLLLAMLLNPASGFFKQQLRNPDSYVRRIRHTDLRDIEAAVSEQYRVQTEYFLDVEDQTVSTGRGAEDAVLYVIMGTKKP
ncbi:MAG: class I SAM-dependent methyltransferase [Armatimonadetes bacterium]|nr:class I SAM-dependent methyltransferase [Armatimonadota bacterium]